MSQAGMFKGTPGPTPPIVNISGTATTTNATPTNVITVDLGSTPATYLFSLSSALFNASTPSGAGYVTYTTVRTDGSAATIIGDTDSITHEDVALTTTVAEIIASGNNAIFQVTGVVGLTINWLVVGNYIKVT